MAITKVIPLSADEISDRLVSSIPRSIEGINEETVEVISSPSTNDTDDASAGFKIRTNDGSFAALEVTQTDGIKNVKLSITQNNITKIIRFDETGLYDSLEDESGNRFITLNELQSAAMQEHTWLPSVQTNDDLPTPIDNTLNYLCKVLNDADEDNIGIWQLIAGSEEWTFYDSDITYATDKELSDHDINPSAHFSLATLDNIDWDDIPNGRFNITNSETNAPNDTSAAWLVETFAANDLRLQFAYAYNNTSEQLSRSYDGDEWSAWNYSYARLK